MNGAIAGSPLWTTAASDITHSALELAHHTVGVGVARGAARRGLTEEDSVGGSSVDPSW
jgi:hypothetical protein